MQTPEPPVPGPVPAPHRPLDGPREALGASRALRLAGAPPLAARFFAETAGRLHGIAVQVVDGAAPDADITVAIAPLGAAGAELPPAATGPDPRPAAPAGADERHRITVGGGRAHVAAASPEAAFRALTGLVQVIGSDGGTVTAPVGELADGPRFHWRSLSLDVVRHFFTAEEVRRVIDLLALYRFSVLHLHLTDVQGWRLESKRWPRLTEAGPHYTREEFAGLVDYAAERYITVVPEIDLPGHVGAAVQVYPELEGERRFPHPVAAYLHPDTEIARTFIADMVAEFAEAAPGPFVHIGGDEAWGMAAGDYARMVRHAHACAVGAGKRVVAWQEAARAGVLRAEDLLQYWIGEDAEFDADGLKARAPAHLHPMIDTAAASFEEAPGDVPAAVAAGVPVLASPKTWLYLDRPYSAPAAADQEEVRGRVGMDAYAATSLAAAFEWEPDASVRAALEFGGAADPRATAHGVEAAVWGETLTSFDDLAFLLLPRLPGIGEKAWTARPTSWADHADRLVGHDRYWARLGFGGHYRPA